jgi:hypothetical protein
MREPLSLLDATVLRAHNQRVKLEIASISAWIIQRMVPAPSIPLRHRCCCRAAGDGAASRSPPGAQLRGELFANFPARVAAVFVVLQRHTLPGNLVNARGFGAHRLR